MDEKVEEELSAPLSFFVEVSSYTAMTNEQELTYKKFQGVTLTGAARTHHQLGQGQWS